MTRYRWGGEVIETKGSPVLDRIGAKPAASAACHSDPSADGEESLQFWNQALPRFFVCRRGDVLRMTSGGRQAPPNYLFWNKPAGCGVNLIEGWALVQRVGKTLACSPQQDLLSWVHHECRSNCGDGI